MCSVSNSCVWSILPIWQTMSLRLLSLWGILFPLLTEFSLIIVKRDSVPVVRLISAFICPIPGHPCTYGWHLKASNSFWWYRWGTTLSAFCGSSFCRTLSFNSTHLTVNFSVLPDIGNRRFCSTSSLACMEGRTLLSTKNLTLFWRWPPCLRHAFLVVP